MSSYDVSFQRALLRLCMIDAPFNAQAMRYVEPSFFTTPALGWCYRAITRYREAYGGCATDAVMRTEVGKAPEAHRSIYAYEVEQIIKCGVVPESDYIRTELTEFIQRNLFSRAHAASADLYNDGKYTEAYDLMMKANDEIRLVTFDPPDRSWFFDEFKERQQARYLRSLDPTEGVYTTGIGIFDSILNGGLHRGELFYILGDAKVGKTTWMINKGAIACRVCRVPVLHINLEGSRQLVEDRYETWFARDLYTRVKSGNINARIHRELQAEYYSLRQLLVIRSYGKDWDTNILSIMAELEELKSQGFVPEMIIIDYGDLLGARPGVRADSPTQVQLASAKDMKKLANMGYAIWTGSQVQRPKAKKDNPDAVLRARDIADCYAKVRVADGWGSLNATQEEKDSGYLRLFWEGYRDGMVGKLFRLECQFDRMRYGISATEVMPPKLTSKPEPPPTTLPGA
jgi:replicative DNA helicase